MGNYCLLHAQENSVDYSNAIQLFVPPTVRVYCCRYTHQMSNFAGWRVSLKSIPMVIEVEFPAGNSCGPDVVFIVIPDCSRAAPTPTPDRLVSSVFLKISSTASILEEEMCGLRVKRYSTERPPPVIRSSSLCVLFGTTVGLITCRRG